jgi:penicillin-insensitive murein DD-endopeptidase
MWQGKLFFLAMGLVFGMAAAQEPGTLAPEILSDIPDRHAPGMAASALFSRVQTAAPIPAQAVGFYAKGCLAGAEALPVSGPTWQVMRLSRNRNWGHPRLVAFLEHFSQTASAVSGWPGLLIGDMAQPRGGPMHSGHASHQIGLDADIWMRPMPEHLLTRAEREQMSSISVVAIDQLDVDAEAWSAAHLAIIRAAAQEPAVQRVFVNPAIKKALCRSEKGQSWMSKVRPTAGHDYHFHVRLYCPPGDAGCTAQDPVPAGDGCDASLDWWFSDAALHPKPGPVKVPLSMDDLPAQCGAVLEAK